MKNVALLAWLCMPLLFLSSSELKYPRYAFYLLPPVAAFAARGAVLVAARWSAAPQPRAQLLLLAAILVLGPQGHVTRKNQRERLSFQLRTIAEAKVIYRDRSTENFERIREQVRFLRANVRPGDTIVSSFDDPSLGYYLDRWVYGFLNSERDDRYFMGLLDDAHRRGKNVWFVDSLDRYDFCQTPGNAPVNIDCTEKYPRFVAACLPYSDESHAACRPQRF